MLCPSQVFHIVIQNPFSAKRCNENGVIGERQERGKKNETLERIDERKKYFVISNIYVG